MESVSRLGERNPDMKKPLYFYAFVVFALVSCDSVDPLPEGAVLASVTYNLGDQSWVELYEYNDMGQLTSVEDQNGLGQRKSYLYGGNRLIETLTIRLNNEQVVFRDSITYNAAGQVEKVYGFNVNGGTDLSLYHVKTMTYDSQGQLIEVASDIIDTDDYNPRDVYHWQDGNVVQVDRFNGATLLQQFYLTYDDKVGLNLESFSFLGYPEAATRNNVISTDWTDYTGVLDTACKPCTMSYQYSSNGIPTSFSTNWSYSATFSFRELQ